MVLDGLAGGERLLTGFVTLEFAQPSEVPRHYLGESRVPIVRLVFRFIVWLPLGLLARLLYGAWLFIWLMSLWAGISTGFLPVLSTSTVFSQPFAGFCVGVVLTLITAPHLIAFAAIGRDALEDWMDLLRLPLMFGGGLSGLYLPTQYNSEIAAFAPVFIWYALALFAGWVVIYGVLTGLSRIVESNTFREWIVHGRGGSARWGGPLAFARNRYRPNGKAPIFLGRSTHKYDPWIFCRSIGVDDENHLVTIAQARSGKSTTAIWPNLVTYPYPDSVFVLDPRGEHAERTAKRRAKQGQQVVILDPFQQTPGLKTHCFNPLAEIDPQSPRAKEDIAAIADACVISESNTDAGQHFEGLHRAMITGLIAHILTTEPSERHNLPAVYDYFLSVSDDAKFRQLLTAMSRNSACGNAPREAVLMYERAGRNEKGSIFTTTLQNISWIASDGMREHLMRSDFTLSQLRTEPTSLYVVLDFDAMQPKQQGRFMRVLINLAFRKCLTVPLPSERKHRRTLFILDEVAQLGPMPSIERAYRTLAGDPNRAKIWTFFQDYQALTNNYDPSALMGNSTKQFFGCGEMQTAEEIAGYLGSYRHVRNAGYEVQRSLLDAQEVYSTLGQHAPVEIVITGGGAIMMLRRAKTILGKQRTANYRVDDIPDPLPLTPEEDVSEWSDGIKDSYENFFVGKRSRNRPLMLAAANSLQQYREKFAEKLEAQAMELQPEAYPAHQHKPDATPETQPKKEPSPKPRRSDLTEEQQEVLSRYQLSLPIKKAEVPGLWIQWLGQVPPHLRDQVNRDFEIITQLAG